MQLQQRMSARAGGSFAGARLRAQKQQRAAAAGSSSSGQARRPASVSRRAAVSARAMLTEYSPSNKEFIDYTLEQFPDEGVANVEQARVLFSHGGYTYLDVRSTLEADEVGKAPKGAVNVPFVICTRVYDAEQQKKVVKKTPNADFIAQVQKRFPDKNAKLLVACATGRQYAIDALEALDEAGYANIVGLRGGYNAWSRTWDNKLGRRRYGEYAENYSHDGDSCGIHSSGAGFEKMDPIENWRPTEY